jgi:hypothetical protein
MEDTLENILDEFKIVNEHEINEYKVNEIEPRDNIIKELAIDTIRIEIVYKFTNLMNIYIWNWCYQQLFEHVFNNKEINIKEIMEKTKKNLLQIHKLEDTFPPNIYEWKHLKEYTNSMLPGTELLLSRKTIIKIKNLDTKYKNCIEKIIITIDKYTNRTTITYENLLEIKNSFENIYELQNPDIILRVS